MAKSANIHSQLQRTVSLIQYCTMVRHNVNQWQ